MIKAPTDAELRAFIEAASKPDYGFQSFDLRSHERCVFGHVKAMRGDATPITDDIGRQMEATIWATRNPRLIRLIAVEKPAKNMRPDLARTDRDKRSEVAARFRLLDAVGAARRYFDHTIDEAAIWPWAARGFHNITRWHAS